MNAFRNLLNSDPDAAAADESRDSNHASAMIAGPRVINRNNNDGGYFVVFKKESMVNIAFFWFDHFAGSPYMLIARNTMKRAVALPPIASNMRRRHA